MGTTALFFAEGHAFFVGAVIIVIAVAARVVGGKGTAALGRFGILLGAIFVALSATPLSVWVYVVWALAALRFFFARQAIFDSGRVRTLMVAAPLLAASLAAVALEIPWHIMPSNVAGARRNLVVIGDSITAGVDTGEKTWPAILRYEEGLTVHDLSEPGLSSGQALSVVEGLAPETFDDAVVIVEIGGNDMLAFGVSAREFETNLDRLLAFVSKPGGRVVMLELPLPPFYNRFGRIQRRLAVKHGTVLVPKAAFAQAFSDPRNTVDGLHLSQEGQDKMAEMILSVMRGDVSDS